MPDSVSGALCAWLWGTSCVCVAEVMAGARSGFFVAAALAFCFLLSVCTALYSVLPLFALVALVLAVMVFFFPAYGLMLVMAFFLIQNSPIYLSYGILARSFTISDVVGAIVVLGWIRQEIRAGHSPGDAARDLRTALSTPGGAAAIAAVGAYVLWQMFSVLWSSSSFSVTVGYVRDAAEAFVLFALIVLMIRTEVLARRAATVYVVTAVVLALYTIRHFSSLGGFAAANPNTLLAVNSYRGGLPEGTNELSIILACAPALTFFALGGVSRWLRYTVAVASIPLIALAIAILSSREAYVSTGIALVASVLLAGQFRYRLTTGLLLVLIGFAVFLALNANSLPYWVTQRFTEADVATFGSRAPFWVVALHLFAANPLGGLGLGGFEQIIQHYHVNPYLGVSATHNQYVHALVDTGIFGFVALIGMVVILGYIVLRVGHRHPVLIVTFLIMVVDMGAGDVLQSHFSWVVLGLVVAGALAKPQGEPDPRATQVGAGHPVQRPTQLTHTGRLPMLPLSPQHGAS